VIRRRPAEARVRARFGWLDSRHTFSFGHYHDDAHMGFGPLRVINEDRVTPGAGFDTHGHSDMEILSYVLEGELAHKDSIGTGSVIRPGEVQRMSAGTGIRHSEFNPSPQAPVHFLQIWILPEREGLKPGYQQSAFPLDDKGRLHLVASGDGRDGSLTINQDVDLYAGRLTEGEIVERKLRDGGLGWLQVARGAVSLNGVALATGDGAAIEKETDLVIRADSDAEILLFEMVP
jgi:quercetin 2,3-dioxygenase